MGVSEHATACHSSLEGLMALTKFAPNFSPMSVSLSMILQHIWLQLQNA